MQRKSDAPVRSRPKRRPGYVKLLKNGSRKPIRVPVIQSVRGGPKKKRVAGRPNLAKPLINGTHGFLRVQNFRERTRIRVNKKPPDHKSCGLGVRSGRTVWMDGPGVFALMFGDS